LVNKHGTVGDVPPSLGREIFAALQVMNAFQHISVVYDGRKTVFSQKPLNFPDNKRTVRASNFTHHDLLRRIH
jgi:hypothetical protein